MALFQCPHQHPAKHIFRKSAEEFDRHPETPQREGNVIGRASGYWEEQLYPPFNHREHVDQRFA